MISTWFYDSGPSIDDKAYITLEVLDKFTLNKSIIIVKRSAEIVTDNNRIEDWWIAA